MYHTKLYPPLMFIHGHIILKTFNDFEVKHLYSLELNTAFAFKE